MFTEFTTPYRELTPPERTFVDAFVKDIEETAVKSRRLMLDVLHDPRPVSHEYLLRPLVRSAISERVKELSDAMELNVYKSLKELRSIAYSNIGDFFTFGQDGMPYANFSACTPEQMAAVKTIKYEETTRGRKLEFTLHDKPQMLLTVLKMQGLLDTDTPALKEKSVNRQDERKLTDETAAANAYAQLING